MNEKSFQENEQKMKFSYIHFIKFFTKNLLLLKNKDFIQLSKHRRMISAF